MPALAIADENSVTGIVRAHSQARNIARLVAARQAAPEHGPPRPAHIAPPPSADVTNIPRLIPAAQLIFQDGVALTALTQNRRGWANLCRLISKGRLRVDKGHCQLRLNDLYDRAEGLVFLLHPPQALPIAGGAKLWWSAAQQLTRRLGEQIYLLMSPFYDGQDQLRFVQIAAAAKTLGLSTIASARPLMHHGRRRRLADVLTAIRTSTRVDQLGRAALANAERAMLEFG